MKLNSTQDDEQKKGEQHTWVVARLGAAMHYAVPRIFHRAGLLERLYTDFYATRQIVFALSRVPKVWRGRPLERALSRRVPNIPEFKVRHFPVFGIEYHFRRSRANDAESSSATHLWAGREFGRKVTRSGFAKASAVYTFTTAALEILEAANRDGLFTVVEQTIAARAMEEELIAEEQRRFPGWTALEHTQGRYSYETIKRERREWELADLILCGSEFVRRSIAHSGGPVDKCVVVRYGVDTMFSAVERQRELGPLKVLSVGEAGLRKGVTYAYQVCKLLKNAAEFRWVGPVTLAPGAQRRVAKNIDFTGPV